MLYIVFLQTVFSFEYLEVFKACHQYEFLPQISCDGVQLHCDQSASGRHQTQDTDRAVATVRPQLQDPGRTDTPYHLIQRLT